MRHQFVMPAQAGIPGITGMRLLLGSRQRGSYVPVSTMT